VTDKKIDESWKKQVESEKDRGPIPQIDFISFISCS
jgi:hypothetical protein